MTGPLQIIQTSDSEEDCFVLKQENLDAIIGKIPPDMKVAVVAVVGAFRTGKSFLLNLFLRYLRSSQDSDLSQAWMLSEGEELLEGNMNEGGWSVVDSDAIRKEMSFAWRGGQQRQTTGIWMWSEPFIRTTSATNSEKLAVLLMDTQGMFDNETTMTLTAQIFGLSTLVSSFQIYNVDKRIQEDNLQHLALFSEYGRMALLPESEFSDAKEALEGKLTTMTSTEHIPASSETAAAAATALPIPAPSTETAADEVVKPPAPPAQPTLSRHTSSRGGTLTRKSSMKEMKPFQRLQFLVRDWQNFDTEYNEGDSDEIFTKVHAEMQKYLQEVLGSRTLSDLKSTREQIVRCFEKLDCFLLPHPGFEVTKKTYDGSISKIDPTFRAMLNKFIRYIFDQELEAKIIAGRAITGPELRTYFEVYVRMFQAGEKSFPKAMTMLDATAEANNRNAFDLAVRLYKHVLEKAVGQDLPFIKESDLRDLHEVTYNEAVATFDEMATMGAESSIEKMRDGLLETLEEERKRYFTTNALRNPFKDLEFYLLPIAVALVSWFLSVITDVTCSTDFCERVEDTFVNIYFFILLMVIVLTWKQISSAWRYLKELMPEATAQVQAALFKQKSS
jgi:atlastin